MGLWGGRRGIRWGMTEWEVEVGLRRCGRVVLHGRMIVAFGHGGYSAEGDRLGLEFVWYPKYP